MPAKMLKAVSNKNTSSQSSLGDSDLLPPQGFGPEHTHVCKYYRILRGFPVLFMWSVIGTIYSPVKRDLSF